MSDGINHIRMEYEARNLTRVLSESKNLEEQNKRIVDLIKEFNNAIEDLDGKYSESAKTLKTVYMQALKELKTASKDLFSSEGVTQMLQDYKREVKNTEKQITQSKKEELNKRKQAYREEMESNVKELDRLTKKEQEIKRKLADSQNSLLKGKKNTPSEVSYLKQELIDIQKQAKNTEDSITSLYRKFDGAKSQGSKAIEHRYNALNFTDVNTRQRQARNYLDQSRGDYDRKVKAYNDSVRDFGENSNGSKALKAELDVITRERQKQLEILNEETEKLIEMGRLTKEEGQDEINRQNILQKSAEASRASANAIKEDKDARKELLTLVQQQSQIEQKITTLSTNQKGKISEVSKNQHKNEISALQQQKQEIEKQIDAIERKNKLGGETIQKIKEQVQEQKNANALTEAHNKDLQNQGKLLSDTIKNFAKFTLYYQSIRILSQSVQKALDTMKELDKVFTDIRIVTQGTKEETNQLAQEYNQLAKEVGSTTTEVAEGAVEWLRQGKTAEETTQLLKTSMTFAKVGALESSQATELLTSTMNGYKFEVKDAMSVVDKMTAIDLEAATSTEELATALARTANMANTSGVSFEKLLGMIGTVSSVTRRSAETIRRSL